MAAPRRIIPAMRDPLLLRELVYLLLTAIVYTIAVLFSFWLWTPLGYLVSVLGFLWVYLMAFGTYRRWRIRRDPIGTFRER